ncbi:MAG: S8 family serine peptidase, partial [Deltaproteobacteria bacterium]|nr:S8 family serine peptidase [Deltaproteobacteria bacterium]
MNDLSFTKLKFIPIILFSILIFQISIASAGTVAPDLQAILDTSGFTEGIPVIITFKGRIDLKQYADKDRKSRRTRIIRALREQALLQGTRMRNFTRTRGIQNIQPLWLINGMALTVPPDVVQDLANNPEIDEIRLDKVFPLSIVQAARVVPQAGWNLEAIDAPALWTLGYRGQGVVIGSMDTGVDLNHPDLRDRWRGGVNSWLDFFPAPGSASNFPYDPDGHGTQTVGLMVGGQASGTAIGVAPDAKWIAAKIFNDHKFTTSSVLHQAFAWMADPDENPATDDAPDIVNNSWGFVGEVDQCTPDFRTDIETLKALGIAVVFAAGNEAKIPPGPSSIAPANDPSSFAVGAVGDFPYTVASFSSRGPSACDGGIYPELVAPGVLVKTTDLSFGGVSPDPYTVISGTSFAAAHVSGVMALLLAAYPNLPLTDPDPNDMENVVNLEDALKDPASVLDLGPLGPDNNYGHGLVNAIDAFNLIDLDLDPCAISADVAAQPDASTPGVPVNFTSAVTGGTPPFAYVWDLDGDKQQDCDTADCVFTYQSFYAGIIELTITDALGCKAYATQMVNIGINILGVV